MWPIVGGVRNGAAEGDWRWDLNPDVAAISRRGPHGFGGEEGGENHAALAEWGPRGSDTADGARNLNHGLLLLFPRSRYPRLGKERRKDCVHL